MYLEKELGMPYLIFVTLGLVGSILILLIVASIIFFVKRKKKMALSKGLKIDVDGYDQELLEIFGIGNIVAVDNEMSRVTVEVKDIDLVDTARLQEKGASGVLLVGNKVKCNFKENSEKISNYLKGNINND